MVQIGRASGWADPSTFRDGPFGLPQRSFELALLRLRCAPWRLLLDPRPPRLEVLERGVPGKLGEDFHRPDNADAGDARGVVAA